MSYRDKSAAELELERHLRAAQDEAAFLRRQVAGQRTDVNILFLVSLALMAVVVLLGIALDTAVTRADWAEKRGDYWRAQAVRPWRDWARPAIEVQR